MNKASRLAAERDVILHDRSIPDALALTMTRPKAREINKLTRRIRTGVSSLGSRDIDDGDDDDMVHAPLENVLRQIIKSTKKTKPKTVPPTPQTPATRRRIPSPPTRLPRPVPTPSHTFPTKKTKGWGSALKEGAMDGLRKRFGVSKPKGSTRPRALKNLDPQPGWEDFVNGKKTKRPLFPEKARKTPRWRS